MNFKFNKDNTKAMVEMDLGWTGKRPLPAERTIVRKEDVVREFNEKYGTKASVTSIDGPNRLTNFTSEEKAKGKWVLLLTKKTATKRAPKVPVAKATTKTKKGA